MSDTELISTGSMDYVSGTESYAMRYFQGVLFSNGIIKLSDVNGMEGLFSSAAAKIKQFISWIYKQLKSLWNIFFGPRATVKVTGADAVNMWDTKFTLKEGAPEKLSGLLKVEHTKLESALARYFSKQTEWKINVLKLGEEIGFNHLKVDKDELAAKYWESISKRMQTNIENIEKSSTLRGFVNNFNDHITLTENLFKNIMLHAPGYIDDFKNNEFAESDKVEQSVLSDSERIKTEELYNKFVALMISGNNLRLAVMKDLNHALSMLDQQIMAFNRRDYFVTKK